MVFSNSYTKCKCNTSINKFFVKHFKYSWFEVGHMLLKYNTFKFIFNYKEMYNIDFQLKNNVNMWLSKYKR